jgi:hypothetical protein
MRSRHLHRRHRRVLCRRQAQERYVYCCCSDSSVALLLASPCRARARRAGCASPSFARAASLPLSLYTPSRCRSTPALPRASQRRGRAPSRVRCTAASLTLRRSASAFHPRPLLARSHFAQSPPPPPPPSPSRTVSLTAARPLALACTRPGKNVQSAAQEQKRCCGWRCS